MKLITRYILFKCIGIASLILLGFAIVFSIFSVLNELGNVGKGSYTFISMLIYTAASIPNYMYLLAPMATLIGGMSAMLGLVKTSEYAIFRTSGISLKDIAKILVIFGIIFAIFTALMGEFIAPYSNQFAKVFKQEKTQIVATKQLSSGIWSRDADNSIINVASIPAHSKNQIAGIRIFKYNDTNILQQYITADIANYTDHTWILDKPTIYDYTKSSLQITTPENLVWKSSLEPNYFKVLVVAPEEMSANDLYKYTNHLRKYKQSASNYETTLWNKLLYPFSCISMALIVLGFIPNNARHGNLGSKLFAGIVLGLVFFFTNKLIGFGAVIFHINPIFAAIAPTLLLLGIGGYIISKKE